jgi:hypothetical protein
MDTDLSMRKPGKQEERIESNSKAGIRLAVRP